MAQASAQTEIATLQDRIARKRLARVSARVEEERLRQIRTKQLRRELRAMKKKAAVNRSSSRSNEKDSDKCAN